MTTPFVEANGASIPAIGLGTWDLRERTCVRINPPAVLAEIELANPIV